MPSSAKPEPAVPARSIDDRTAQNTTNPPSASAADAALTGAIKAALDSGDVERASKLLDILRGKR